MNPLYEALPHIQAYEPSVLVLVILCLVVCIQAFLQAPLALIPGKQNPGIPVKGDHEQLSFRVMRTFSNSAENLPMFGFALLSAIWLFVPATFVNWVASIYLLFRLGFWFFYYTGFGAVAGGPRTMMYVGGLASNIVLALACLYMLF